MASDAGIPSELRAAAYAALRDEISHRSSAQLTLMTTSLAAFTTLGAVAYASTPPANELFLFVPIVASWAGTLWLDHHRRIGWIATYILREIFDGRRGSFQEIRESDATRRAAFYIPILASFVGPSIAALWWTADALCQTRTKALSLPLWILGFILTLGFVPYFLHTAIQGEREARIREQSFRDTEPDDISSPRRRD